MRAMRLFKVALIAAVLVSAAATRDADNDGIVDDDDYCDDTPSDVPVNEYGCSQLQLDADGDGICNPDRPRYETGRHKGRYMPVYKNWCVGLDNCKHVYNPSQKRTHRHRTFRGDACFRGTRDCAQRDSPVFSTDWEINGLNCSGYDLNLRQSMHDGVMRSAL